MRNEIHQLGSDIANQRIARFEIASISPYVEFEYDVHPTVFMKCSTRRFVIIRPYKTDVIVTQLLAALSRTQFLAPQGDYSYDLRWAFLFFDYADKQVFRLFTTRDGARSILNGQYFVSRGALSDFIRSLVSNPLFREDMSAR